MSLFYMLIVTVILNIVVGTLIGISGIAGFLLPIVYTSILNIELKNALAISFMSFLIGGIFGTLSYKKSGNLDIGFSKKLNLGSIFGAVFGVYLNSLVPTAVAKVLLYIIVLSAGLSILLKKEDKSELVKKDALENNILVVIIGFLTATICSLTGAGGPILVVPILTLLGMDIKLAVGVGLFNQVIIALPATIGYFMKGDFKGLEIFIVVSIIFHIVGILLGSKISEKINIDLLKKIVSALSIVVSIYMLVTTLF